MTIWPKAVATAFIFLTRLPVPAIDPIEPEDEGRSLLCFPLVGLTIGLLLWLLAGSLSNGMSSIVIAAIITVCWALVTGGLHLDGLGDSADGWLAGGDTERTLRIMHDSHSGSAAVIAITSVLLMKFAALMVIVEHHLWVALIIAPIIGRCIPSLLFIPGTFFHTPYVQAKGIANNYIDHCPEAIHRYTAVALLICAFLLDSFTAFLVILILGSVLLMALRRLMMKRLNGSTGDTAGACIEISETLVLILCSALLI